MFRRLAAAAALCVTACVAHAAPTYVYSNFNGDHVSHGGSTSSSFTLASAAVISGIEIYVQSADGNFTNSGTLFFFNATTNTTQSFAVTVDGVAHQYGPNDYDEVLSYTGLATLAAGTYTVSADASVAAEWAYNAASNNQGFIQLIEAPADVPEPASLALVGGALLGLGWARRRAA